MNKQSVLFVCTHNSARSQMAEGLLRNDFGDQYEVASAGTGPTQVNPFAIQAMADVGIDISHHYSQHVDEFGPFDYVVTVCNNARENCPVLNAKVETIHYRFDDPSATQGTDADKLAAFCDTRDRIRNWLRERFGGQATAHA